MTILEKCWLCDVGWLVYIQYLNNTNIELVTTSCETWHQRESERLRPRFIVRTILHLRSTNVISAMIVARCMTVKSKRGRRRYTAFEVPSGTDRHAAEAAVSRVGSAKVITCGRGYAVVRSLPEDRRILEETMSAEIAGSTAFDCSGTLRALRTRHPQLNAPRKRRKRSCTGRAQFPNALYCAPHQGALE